MLSAADVSGNRGHPDAAAGAPGRRGGACSCLAAPRDVRRAPRPDHESRDKSLTWVIFRDHAREHDHGNQQRSRRLPRGS